MSALLTHIKRTDWDLFVTCTYANSRTMNMTARRSMQFQFLRRCAMWGEKGQKPRKFSELRWIIREEFGEQTQRLHWHALVSGMPRGILRKTTCTFLMGYWEGIGGGMSRIRIYDAGQDGADYMVKGLEGDEWSTAGANGYEIGKFSAEHTEQSLMLIPSKSLLALWKGLAETGK